MIARFSLVLSVWLIAASMANAQISPSEPEVKPSIELKLSARSLMVCVGSSLPLELELTNRGAEGFKEDKFNIWNQFTYGFMGDREEGRGGGMGASCFRCQPDPIVIGHEQTYKSSFDFDLKHDFFKDAGKYNLRLKIAGVQSNDVEFELFSCQ